MGAWLRVSSTFQKPGTSGLGDWSMSDAYALPDARYFVVERGGEVVGGGGFARLQGSSAGDATCELRKMYFRPGARGKRPGSNSSGTNLPAAYGLASQETEARSLGFPLLRLFRHSLENLAHGAQDSGAAKWLCEYSCRRV